MRFIDFSFFYLIFHFHDLKKIHQDEGVSGSCLDKDAEAKAILRIAGRELHSEMFREEAMTEHEK